MTKVENDTAYFLHQSPYRDNSAITHFFTQKNGKVSFIINGLKSKRNAKRPFLQPCQPLLLDYQLRSGLSKLDEIDFAHDRKKTPPPAIEQFMLYQYANELLLHSLPDQLPAPTLFADYYQFLTLLTEQKPHAALRHIEIALIILFAGLPSTDHTEDTQMPILQEQQYWFYPQQGIFTYRQNNHDNCSEIMIEGSHIIAFQHAVDCYNKGNNALSEVIAQGAKPFTTSLINQLLNHRKIKTREVFKSLKQYI